MMLRTFAWKAEDQDFTRETWRRYLSEDRLQKASGMKAGKARQLFLGAEKISQNIFYPRTLYDYFIIFHNMVYFNQ